MTLHIWMYSIGSINPTRVDLGTIAASPCEQKFRVTFVKISWVGGVDVEKVCGGRSHRNANHVLGHLLDHGFDVRFHGDDELAWATEI
jgi:hypothetical protein